MYRKETPYSISEDQLARLEQRLETQKHRATMDLANAFIGDDGCILVAKYLQDYNVLNLDLGGNNIGQGVVHIAEALKLNANIKHVSLEWNNIGIYETSSKALCDALMTNISITSLDLRNNKLSRESGVFLGNTLKENSTLKSLDLRWNELGNEGAKHILGGLKKNTTIGNIELTGNNISEENLRVINGLLGKNREDLDDLPPHPHLSPKSDRYYISPRIYSPTHTGGLEGEDYQASYRILNREKNYAEDLRAKFDAKAIQHGQLEKKLAEAEIKLDQEGRKNEDLEKGLKIELESEKLQRKAMEDEVLRHKENFMTKEINMSKRNQDLDLKISNLVNENTTMSLDIRRLEEEKIKFDEIHKEKMLSLEERLYHQERINTNIEDGARIENDKIRKDNAQEIKELTQKWSIKFKEIEDKNAMLKAGKIQTTEELKMKNAEILDLRMSHESEMTELERKLRDEYNSKHNILMNGYEEKMRSVSNARESMNRKNMEYLEEIKSVEKNYSAIISKKERENSNLMEENSALHKEIATLSASNMVLENENNMKLSLLEKADMEKKDLRDELVKKKQADSNMVNKLRGELSNERKGAESAKGALNKRIEELERKLQTALSENNSIRQEEEALIESIRLNTEKTINDQFENYKRRSNKF